MAKSGRDYEPWLRVHHYSSSGKSTRAWGVKTGRTHTFLSDLEYHFFLLAEWDGLVKDIREQFPLLPVGETQEICKALGVRHPKKPQSGDDIVMTTDFLLSTEQRQEAWSIEPSDRLEKRRVLEKLEIERIYWQRRDVPFHIVTEKEIPAVTVKNIKWIRGVLAHQCSPERLKQTQEFFERTGRGKPIGDVCRESDDIFGLCVGDSLSSLKLLLATKQWKIDIGEPLSTKTILNLP